MATNNIKQIKLPNNTTYNIELSDDAKKLVLASAALTGTPTAPTAAAGTNTTQIATTAFVNTEINNKTISLTGSVTGSGSFDGSGNLSIATTTNHTHNYAGSSSAGGGAKFLETFRQNSTTNTYGTSWNFLAQWIASDRLKFKVINNGTLQNYPIEVDHAYKLVASSTDKNASSAPLSIGSNTQPVYFANGVPVAITGTIANNAASASKVTNKLTVKLNGGSIEGTNLFTFDGSDAKTLNITASSIGAAPAYTYQSTDPGAGSSLTTGKLLIVYS